MGRFAGIMERERGEKNRLTSASPLRSLCRWCWLCSLARKRPQIRGEIEIDGKAAAAKVVVGAATAVGLRLGDKKWELFYWETGRGAGSVVAGNLRLNRVGLLGLWE